MSTRVRPFGRCSRDPPLYRPQLGNLTTCAIELLSTSFVPRFVHSLFALEFPPSKLQRTCALPYFEEKLHKELYILNYLTSLPQIIYIEKDVLISKKKCQRLPVLNF